MGGPTPQHDGDENHGPIYRSRPSSGRPTTRSWWRSEWARRSGRFSTLKSTRTPVQARRERPALFGHFHRNAVQLLAFRGARGHRRRPSLSRPLDRPVRSRSRSIRPAGEAAHRASCTRKSSTRPRGRACARAVFCSSGSRMRNCRSCIGEPGDPRFVSNVRAFHYSRRVLGFSFLRHAADPCASGACWRRGFRVAVADFSNGDRNRRRASVRLDLARRNAISALIALAPGVPAVQDDRPFNEYYFLRDGCSANLKHEAERLRGAPDDAATAARTQRLMS